MSAASDRTRCIEAARDLLDRECGRLGLEPLDSEQVEALDDPAQCFAMLDDMEARVGLNVAKARRRLDVAHGNPSR
ncbi:hypothetical protein [Dyella ginsengisoli]|uniref:hypothetical protein n=1 Tax=Dyella ginsengisoli TaxID=363848 RepID=UPI000369A146|nr:hypothetical protein [Dyella ginsengisoli]